MRIYVIDRYKTSYKLLLELWFKVPGVGPLKGQNVHMHKMNASENEDFQTDIRSCYNGWIKNEKFIRLERKQKMKKLRVGRLGFSRVKPEEMFTRAM